MRLNSAIALTVATVLLTGACSIRDDRSDCTSDVILDFLYTGDGETDIFPDKIDKVNMYVYAEDNSIAGEYIFEKDALTANQGAHLHLFPGNYRIVCWGNAFDNTRIETDFAGAKVAEPAWFDGLVSKTMPTGHDTGKGLAPQSDVMSSETEQSGYRGTDPLYFSALEISVPESLQDVTGTCVFKSSHIDMKVRLKGFRDAIDADGENSGIAFSHTGCPAYTDFRNVPSADNRCNVYPALTEDPDDEESYILQYNVLRFGEDERTTLEITDPGDAGTFHTVSISDFIRQYEIEVDGKQEAVIAVQLTLGSVGIEVVEWNIEDVNPGFDKD